MVNFSINIKCVNSNVCTFVFCQQPNIVWLVNISWHIIKSFHYVIDQNFAETIMTKLYSLDSSLIEEIKGNLSLYSERILLGGLSLKQDTKRTWLDNINSLNEKIPNHNLCIGQSDITKFNYLQCNKELSLKG